MIKRIFVVFTLLFFTAQIACAKSLTFAQISDTHYSVDGKTNSSRDVSVSKKHLYFAIMSLNKKMPRFTVFLGDQTDKSNEQSIKEYMEYTSKLKMPYYFVLGNHDAYKMSGISKEKYLETASKKNPKQPKKRNYTFKPDKNIVCIVLDGSAQLVPSAHGYFSPEQLTWLDKQLKRNKKKLVLIFQHFPLIPPKVNKSHEVLEPEKYFNVLSKHKNVVLISSGHYHKEGFSTDKYGIRHISTVTLLNTPPMYDLIKLDYDNNSYKDASKVKVDIEHVRV